MVYGIHVSRWGPLDQGNKMAYYLLSDGMPLLSGRLPLSDVMTLEDEEGQLRMWRVMCCLEFLMGPL